MAEGRVHKAVECESGLTFDIPEGKSLLHAIELSRRRSVAVGCRNGGCGICKVKVVSGVYKCGLMSQRQVSLIEQGQGYALACRLFPASDLQFVRIAQARPSVVTPLREKKS